MGHLSILIWIKEDNNRNTFTVLEISNFGINKLRYKKIWKSELDIIVHFNLTLIKIFFCVLFTKLYIINTKVEI